MATTLTITSTYAGESAGKIIAPALLMSPTLDRGGVEIMPNVKKSATIQKIDTSAIIADGSCDFTATGTVALTERTLSPKELQVNVQICKTSFVQTWEAIELGYSAFNEVPSSFRDFFLARMAEEVASANEVSFWNGATGTSGQYDGIMTQIAVDAALPPAQEVAGTIVTAENVVGELGKIVDALPPRLYGRPDLHIYVSQNIYKLYKRALGGFGAAGLGANGYRGEGNNQQLGDVMFDGIPLFVAEGLTADQAICTQKSNLYFATGLMSDYNEVQLIDLSPIDGSQNIRFVMRFTAAANYGYAEEIVTYGVTNVAN